MADAHAYFVCRLHPQTTILALEAVAERVAPVEWAPFLTTVKSPMVQKPLLLGVNERVASRLSAARVPAPLVNSRRRIARKHAQQNGSTPAQAHVALVAWHLLITHVPQTIWQPPTVLRVDPLRWHVEVIVTSWKSDRHVATRKTTKEDPT